MKITVYSSAALFLIASLPPISAKDKDHLPLPAQVMSAKTVYIENRSGQAAIGDRAYQEIKNWGRFQMVQERDQADLILLLTAREEVRGGQQNGRVDEDGNIHTSTSPDVWRYSGLTALDPRTGNTLWTESRVASILRKSAIKRAIDELRKRIEEQEAQPKKP
jgi:hypothetical protein